MAKKKRRKKDKKKKKEGNGHNGHVAVHVDPDLMDEDIARELARGAPVGFNTDGAIPRPNFEMD
ncbi:hypothetical protein HY970_01470 [Candidatus Kaiserbacteria bacterium]|nr:hypothetical protein [Candidatus Kaiserbacteria bacterium]